MNALSSSHGSTPPSSDGPTVLIIGDGLAGLACAQGLRQRLGTRVTLTMLDGAASPNQATSLRAPAPSDGDPAQPEQVWARVAASHPPPVGWATDPVAALSFAEPDLLTLSLADLLRQHDVPDAIAAQIPEVLGMAGRPPHISALSALMRSWSAQCPGVLRRLDRSLHELLMAASELVDDLEVECPVTTVHETDDGRHRVETYDGRTFFADQVVCALPPSKAARITWQPGLPEVTQQALNTCQRGTGESDRAHPYFPPLADVPELLASMQREDRGRHLAGDHTEARYTGWDGAVGSGLRVAKRIANSLAPALS